MKKQYILVILLLLLSAFIYACFRTEQTVFNILLNQLLPTNSLASIKTTFKDSILNNEIFVYSLPGGLWVFCCTLLAKGLRLKILNKMLNLEWVPIIFALSLEVLQYFQIIKGRFDWTDLGLFLLFAFLATIAFRKKTTQNQLPFQFNSITILFLLAFFSVFLAHVVY